MDGGFAVLSPRLNPAQPASPRWFTQGFLNEGRTQVPLSVHVSMMENVNDGPGKGVDGQLPWASWT